MIYRGAREKKLTNYCELNKRCKKEITEHFDKLFKDPEFARMITKAMDEAPERYGD